MSKLFILISCYCFSLHSLETKPWLGNPFAFELDTLFSYNQFSTVQGASRQPHSTVHNRDLLIDLGLTPFPAADVQLEAEFGQTNTINWALRSGALQTRIQFLDDISGDFVSLTGGLNLRGASSHFLKSVATPYASEFNAELTGSIGKEWSKGPNWIARAYGFAAVGQGNRGYPWTRARLVGQSHYQNTHRFTLFLESLIGFGRRQQVDVFHFKGWAPFQHQSIDLGASYGYQTDVYGTLTASYVYRVFAHNFPEHVNFFMLSYSLPFSVL